VPGRHEAYGKSDRKLRISSKKSFKNKALVKTFGWHGPGRMDRTFPSQSAP
jgi:hypothetical protein